MNRRIHKILSLVFALVLVIGLLPAAALAAEGDAITLEYGDYTFQKISNPTAGSGEPDGINTNDITGFEANRLNSYAWAVASRGDYIYIGTNRTLFGSALNAVTETIQQTNENITPEMMGEIVTAITDGDVPVNLEEEDYIPQIIKFDVQNGTTEVIYQPETAYRDDGVLCYTDMDGNIIEAADVSSETCSFRSVVQFNGNLYFGSLGVNMLQLVRVDENDDAEVVFQTIGLVSSLRACCIYDDGDGETVYFGGQDTTNAKWRQSQERLNGVLPIVIRYLDPDTAGTDAEDWSGLIADYEDFGQYAYASVYVSGGGNVWDLCSYNGKMYLILAFDRGWAMFRGEKGGENPNEYGWTWTEIVGDDSIYDYPLAMDEEVGILNEQYRAAYSCSEYTAQIKGAGLLESTATPYVYNGKMYIGSFDNATSIQSETVIKALTKLMVVSNTQDPTKGPTLTQIFAPIYEVLSHPQHIWAMDEDENISAVDGANALLEGTTNDYVWRFIEHDGKLYTGTFDSSTAYNYFLDPDISALIDVLEENGIEIPEEYKALMNGSFLDALLVLLEGNDDGDKDDPAGALGSAAINAAASVQDFMNGGGTTVKQLLGAMTELQDAKEALPSAAIVSRDSIVTARADAADAGLNDDDEPGDDEPGDEDPTDPGSGVIPEDAVEMINWLLANIDVEGLTYWAEARDLAASAEHGFDIFATSDGENWEAIVRDGCEDPYNYGARTFTVCNDEVYVGTANPYYGAQLWKLTDNTPEPIPEPTIYNVTVRFGNADMDKAEEGVTVTITADEKDGYEFKKWKIVSGDVALADATAEVTTFVMPAEDVSLEATYKLIPADDDWPVTPPDDDEPTTPTTPTTPEPEKPEFDDVKDDDWFAEAVAYVAGKGIMNGTGDRIFEPESPTTRAMLVTILYRLEGEPAVSGASPFKDVATGTWYTKAVIWANANGIVKGYGDGTFGPTDLITREQFATILYRYVQLKGGGFTGAWYFPLNFEDAADVSDWADEAMHWCVMNGIITGRTETTLVPGGSATRAEAATILMRYIKNAK